MGILEQRKKKLETLIIKGVSTRSFLRQLTNRDKQGPGGPRLYSGNFARSTKVMRPGQTQSPPS